VVSGREIATQIHAKTPKKNANATNGKGLRPLRRETTPMATMFRIQIKKKTTKPTIMPVTASSNAREENDEPQSNRKLEQSD